MSVGCRSLLLLLIVALALPRLRAFSVVPSSLPKRTVRTTQWTTKHSCRLQAGGGWLDDLLPDFLKQREGDFVQLDKSDMDAFGPGPLVVLYQIPETIENDELHDMIHDGTQGQVTASSCVLHRIDPSDTKAEALLDLPMEQALKEIMQNNQSNQSNNNDDLLPTNGSGSSLQILPNGGNGSTTPLLLFSGFSNTHMMDCYNIIGNEIYLETTQVPACAKVVPNAMQKPLRQVLEEIAGDHQDATKQVEG